MRSYGIIIIACLGVAATTMAADDEAVPSGPAATTGAPEAPPVPPLVQEGQALLEKLDASNDRIRSLQKQARDKGGDDRLVIERQLIEAKIQYIQTTDAVVSNLLSQEQLGLEADLLRERVEADLVELAPAIVRHLEATRKNVTDLRRQREDLQATELLALEQKISKRLQWMLILAEAHLDTVVHMDSVGLNETEQRANLTQRLNDYADKLAGRIELVHEQQRAAEQRLANAPDDSTLQLKVRALEERKRSLIDSLVGIANLMDQVELNSTQYRQLLIHATGEVTSDVFRKEVVLGLIEDWLKEARTWLRANGTGLLFKAFTFLLILAIFRGIALATRSLLRRGVTNRANMSQLLQNMLMELSTRGIMFLGLLVAISELGVELGPVLAGLGIAGFIVGFALQDSLANFAAGIMILGYRPFDVDDVIEAATVSGRVSHMSLVSTTVLTFDNQTLIVPNARIWGDVIKNVTNQVERRVDMTFRIAYSEDVKRAEAVFKGVLQRHPKVLEDPAPIVKLHKLQESWMDFAVRPWVKTEDYWDVYWDITRAVKDGFEDAGIEIPVPQRDVHLRTSQDEA